METIIQYFSEFGWVEAIDAAGLVLGLIWLWLVSVIMPIVLLRILQPGTMTALGAGN